MEDSQKTDDILFSRSTVQNSKLTEPISQDRIFSVVSYNVLADCHALRSASHYKWITPEKLSMQSRQVRLLKELQYLDADILCLQEVSPDFFHNVLTSKLKEQGYEGLFKKRLSDGCDEGSATFYRSARFTLLSNEAFSLRELTLKDLEESGLESGTSESIRNNISYPTAVLVTHLKCNFTEQEISVGNIHVGWDPNYRPDLKCLQGASALKKVAKMGNGTAFVLCGDFNSTPECPVYQLMTDGSLNDESATVLKSIKNVFHDGQCHAMIDLWQNGFQHALPKMYSAYRTVTDEDPVSMYKRKADYIWFGGSNLGVNSVLATVPKEIILKGIPNDILPSDHVSLRAELFFQ